MRLSLAGVAIIGATLVLSGTDGMAQCALTSIPLPSQALVEPAPKISCDFASSTLGNGGGSGPSNAINGQSNASPNGTLSMRLDYERQCYRHTEAIFSTWLKRLQASMGETIKAVNKACPATTVSRSTSSGVKTALPLPEAALLSPLSEFSCEFKNDASNKSAGGPQSDASRGPSDINAEAILAMKLDYERQCYRHATLIAFEALQRLQASVRETIKAVNSSSSRALAKQPTSPKPSPVAKPPSAKQPSSAAQPSLAARPAPRPKQQTSDAPIPEAAEQAPCAVFRDRCLGRDPDPRMRSMMRIEQGGM